MALAKPLFWMPLQRGLTPVLKHLSSANQRLSGPGIKDTDFLVESHDLANGKKQALKAKYSRIALETTDGLRWDNWKSSTTGAQPLDKIGQVALNAHCQALLLAADLHIENRAWELSLENDAGAAS